MLDDVGSLKALFEEEGYQRYNQETMHAMCIACARGNVEILDVIFNKIDDLGVKEFQDPIQWAIEDDQPKTFKYMYDKIGYDAPDTWICDLIMENDAYKVLDVIIHQLDEDRIDEMLKFSEAYDSKNIKSILTVKKRQFKLDSI